MKLGIVGLPNVGKSTLFNSLTKAGALSANYPFATIDPNVGIVAVPDERIEKLGELYHTKKVTPATIEFVDIAGLVKGASKGEGLGNQFLANIREVDAIVHVVRCFEDTNIIHVDGNIDPARDIETINLELIFSDLEILERRYAKVAKQARMDKKLAKAMMEQGRIEKERTASIDKAAHPTGAMMSAVFSPLGRDREQRELLSRFGYLLGRYVYLCDALDDLEGDVKSGSYNPLCVMFYNDNDNVTARKKAKKYCTDSVMLTLGELAEVYTKLQPVKHKDIIDNVIYLGLKNSFSEVTGKERHNDK